MHAPLRGAQSAPRGVAVVRHYFKDPPNEAAPRTAEVVAELCVPLSDLM
jgi:hypothetical protein